MALPGIPKKYRIPVRYALIVSLVALLYWVFGFYTISNPQTCVRETYFVFRKSGTPFFDSDAASYVPTHCPPGEGPCLSSDSAYVEMGRASELRFGYTLFAVGYWGWAYRNTAHPVHQVSQAAYLKACPALIEE